MKINCIAICLSVILLLNVVMVLNVPLVMGDDWSASCSSNCTCKWTNGKKSAICSSLQLTTIPTTLSTEIQVLVLNDNHIAYLNQDEFNSLELSNLQRIYLKKSDVQYIHKDAFKNLKILVEIDLSDNRIEMLDRDTFMGNDRLRILYLNGNPLKKLIAYQFPILPHLRTLDLHDCLISFIDPMALANLNLLEFLYLKNNLLESLSEYVFQHMTNLKTLILDENPWQCNCKLRKFRSWYVRSKVNSISLLCKGPPSLKDAYWEHIDEIQFGCPPRVEIFNNEDVQNIDIGSNTTFSCLVYGDPLPEVSWELNGKVLDNDNVIFDQESIASDKLWSNVTVFNMTSLDAGIYSCGGQNVVGSSSQNISIYLTEIVQHVLVKTPETFWYFGLIMGTFGTVFLLILISFVVCLCKRSTRQRRHPNKNGVKGSVSFNDQEKKLLDLSITTTTNERGDSCGIDNNTPSMNKTESVIGFEPIEITVENHRNGGGGGGGGGSGVGMGNLSIGHVHHMSMTHHSLQKQQQKQHFHQQQQQQQQQMMNISHNGPSTLMTTRQQMLTVADGSCSVLGIPTSSPSTGGGGGSSIAANSKQIPEEFPLNVGVFPPPPEFCSNVVTNPAYGNIFISVSVTQDMLDNSDINIYPDLLNIPKRVQENNAIANGIMTAGVGGNGSGCGNNSGNCSSNSSCSGASSTGTIVPISSFATLPRNNQRRGILKKDSSLQHQQQTNLYPHDEIVSYHNLDTSYSQGYQEYQQQQLQKHQQQTQHHATISRCSADGVSRSGGGGGSGSNAYHCSQCRYQTSNKNSGPPQVIPTGSVVVSSKANCVNCMKMQPTPSSLPPPAPSQAIAQSLYVRDNNTPPVCNTPPLSESGASCALGPMRPLCKTPSSCLKYDNMGRRITASGNSTLSLPDEERLENETLFNDSNPLTKAAFPKKQPQQQQTMACKQQVDGGSPAGSATGTPTMATTTTTNSEFVSL